MERGKEAAPSFKKKKKGSRGRCIFRMQKLKMFWGFFGPKTSIYIFSSSPANVPNFPRLSLSPYGVFLELLSSPHPSVSKSRIKGAYSFSFPPLLPEFSPPGRSERTEVEQLLFSV